MEVDNMNPCENCTRVPDPKSCDKKRCLVWQEWWFPKWERTRLAILRLLNNQTEEHE